MKKLLLGAFAFSVVGATAQETPDNQLPTNPEPGKCYVKCVTPDEWTNETVRVLKRPAYKKLKVIPATYRTVTETYVETPAYKQLKVIPATFEYVTETYVRKEGTTSLSTKQATFSTQTDEVEVSPSYAKWEYSTYPGCKSSNPGDCRFVCWKEYPAKYKTITSYTLNPATSSQNDIAAQDGTYKRRVVKTPASVEEIEIPAVTKTYTRQVVDQPARITEEDVPAEYQEYTKRILAKKGGVTTWEAVDCGLVSAGVDLGIYWNLGSATLTSEAKKAIDRSVLKYMRENPNQSVELSSHTDSRGDDASNQDLSQRRADAVTAYLVANGINEARISSKGYGETQLVNGCSNGVKCSESEHRQNRRTVYKVIGGK